MGHNRIDELVVKRCPEPLIWEEPSTGRNMSRNVLPHGLANANAGYGVLMTISMCKDAKIITISVNLCRIDAFLCQVALFQQSRSPACPKIFKRRKGFTAFDSFQLNLL